jgi:hypothetical protein
LRKRLLYGLVVVLALVGLVLVVKSLGRKKNTPRRSTTQASDSTRTRRSRRVRGATDTLTSRVGSTARGAARLARRAGGAKGKRGTLQGQTPEQRMAEKKRLREEQRRLKQELRRRKREERLAQQGAKKRGKGRSGKRSSYDAYTLKGTVAGTYALIGSRRLERGDVIAGKKIIEIGSDRVVLEQFGTRSTVVLGEPVDRSLAVGRPKRQKQ